MTNTFTATGGTSHSTPVTGLMNGQTYNYYVRCQDTAGNANTNDFVINFSIAPALQGDINLDGIVNIQDILVIVNDFGKTSGFNPAVDVAPPFGEINIFDVMVVDP